MTGSGSPCGACKFLRRKCVRGCVFAPYFCHEQGATHFAAIHKVFGASNVSKLLARLPLTERCEAAVTISYEAQARLQDPIYGCVSHIFALQQQVVNLQAQLASLKEQAAESIMNGGSDNGGGGVNEKSYCRKVPCHPQDLHSWFQSGHLNNVTPEFNPNPTHNPYCDENYRIMVNSQSNGNYEHNHLAKMEESGSYGSFEETSANYSMYSLDHIQSNAQQWSFNESADDLQSVAFGNTRHW
ncbi:LOB domain-containing protein 29-like [Momordica charantia]|uniref:LOB domain-containing protein 29-like n=1 Tax=Momordica charantia TaxID=3673 RepID=A0A6J1CWZ3_MOMCH|nr:LOB domain-containing protein 29-like [Momordica charantia]